jgi:glutamyl/glutaminyl-tRNA synthetase
VNAVYVWGLAAVLGGRVALRIEDHDRTRSRPEFEHGILEDLEWLGLRPHHGCPPELRAGRSGYRQSDATDRYVEAAGALRRLGLVYACACSRREITAGAVVREGLEAPYPGTCRARGLAPAPGLGLRVVMTPGLEAFDDALLGRQQQDPAAQCGDLLICDRHGHWTYQFAVVVDDLRHGVDLVVRGEDLLTSTGRQLRLARLLGGRGPVVFLHHPLVRRPDGAKLSKSNRDTGVRDLRAAGHPADAVLGLAAHACGLQTTPDPLPADRLARLFE